MEERLRKYRVVLALCTPVPHSREAQFGYALFDSDPYVSWAKMVVQEVQQTIDKLRKENAHPPEWPRSLILVHERAEKSHEMVQALLLTLETANLELEGMLDATDPTWFAACERADIAIPLVTDSFMRSAWCELKVTYAKDANKELIPVVTTTWTCGPLDLDPDVCAAQIVNWKAMDSISCGTILADMNQQGDVVERRSVSMSISNALGPLIPTPFLPVAKTVAGDQAGRLCCGRT